MNSDFNFVNNISYYVVNQLISTNFEIIQAKKKVVVQAYQGELGQIIETITKNNFKEVENFLIG